MKSSRKTLFLLGSALLVTLSLAIVILANRDSSKPATANPQHATELAIGNVPNSQLDPSPAIRIETPEDEQVSSDKRAATGAIQVRARWEKDGTPAVGVAICAYVMSRPAPFLNTASGLTGFDGTCVLEGLEPGTVILRCDRCEGDHRLRLDAGAMEETEFLIPPGLTVLGYVRDENERGVHDADLCLYVSEDGEHFRHFTVVAKSHDDGSFELKSIPERNSMLGARARGMIPSRLTYLSGVPGSTITTLITITSHPGIIRGTVRAPSGKPVANATVQAGSIKPNSASSTNPQFTYQSVPTMMSKTSVDGSFQIDESPIGKVAVEVVASGYAPWKRDVDTKPGEVSVLDVNLEYGFSLIGQVSTPTGDAAAAALVSVGESRSIEELQSRADSDGRYEIRSIEPGNRLARAEARDVGYASSEIHGTEGEVVTWNATLKPKVGIMGVVVDDDDHAVTEAQVQVDGPTNSDSREKDFIGFEVTKDDGSFSCQGMVDGLYSVQITVPRGGLSIAATFVDIRPSTSNQSFRISSSRYCSAYLTGKVVDENGIPIANARISPIASDGHTRSREFLSESVSGGFEIGSLAPGEYRLRVLAPNYPFSTYGPFHVGAKEVLDVGTIQLEESGSLDVVVESEGKSIDEFQASCIREDSWIPAKQIKSESGVSFVDLSKGEWVVRIESDRHAPFVRRFQILPGEVKRFRADLLSGLPTCFVGTWTPLSTRSTEASARKLLRLVVLRESEDGSTILDERAFAVKQSITWKTNLPLGKYELSRDVDGQRETLVTFEVVEGKAGSPIQFAFN